MLSELLAYNIMVSITLKVNKFQSNCCSVVQLCPTLWPHGLQHTRPPCPSLFPRAYSNPYPSSRWCHPTTLSSVVPFSSHLPSFPASHQLVKVLEIQFEHQSFQWIFRADFLKEGLVGSPCSPRDSQESFPTQQFKCSTNSSALSLLYSPTLTSTHDYCKNHSFE